MGPDGKAFGSICITVTLVVCMTRLALGSCVQWSLVQTSHCKLQLLQKFTAAQLACIPALAQELHRKARYLLSIVAATVILLLQVFTLTIAICLSAGSQKPGSVFSVSYSPYAWILGLPCAT